MSTASQFEAISPSAFAPCNRAHRASLPSPDAIGAPHGASTRARGFFAVLCLFAGAFLTAVSAAAEPASVEALRAAEQKRFTDDEIIDGFLKIAFGAEMHLAGRVDRIRKFDGPVRVMAASRAKPDRRRAVANIVSDIRSRVAHLDIAVTTQPAEANVDVLLVRDRDLMATVRERFGRDTARTIARRLKPQCLSGFRKDDDYRISHATVILVADAGEFVFLDCAYEEILQALGPINDDASVPWTMFNDDVQKGFFGVYDQHLLNLLYHPKIKAGMTREEARAVLPELLPAVRAFVARRNGFEP